MLLRAGRLWPFSQWSMTGMLARYLPAVVGLAPLALLVGQTLADVVPLWMQDSDTAHGFFVLPICAWAAYRIARRQPGGVLAPTVPEQWTGALSVLAGGCVHVWAWLVRWPLADFAAWVLMGRGLLMVWGGTALARRYRFPLFFSFFAFPLPASWTQELALWLQRAVAGTSAGLLGLWTLVRQRGAILEVHGLAQPVVVGEECSGIRQLIALWALGALLGHLSGRKWYAQVLLWLGAVPIAVLANTARIVLLVLAQYGKKEGLTGWAHDLPAMVTVPAAVLFYVLYWHILGHLLDGWATDRCTIERESAGNSAASEGMRAGYAPPWGSVGTLLWMCVGWQTIFQVHTGEGICSWLVGSRASWQVVYPELRHKLAELPETLPGPSAETYWVREAQPPATWLAGFADEIQACVYRYRGTQLVLSAYVTYSRKGDDRLHHPEICLGQVHGWPEDLTQRRLIYLRGDKARPVRRYVFEAPGAGPMVVYYWHYTLEPIFAGTPTLVQRLRYRLGHWPGSVTVQVACEQERPEVLQFVEAWDEALRRVCLPEQVQMGCERTHIRLLR
ncbi:MAG: hypothetical protein C4297_09170 [Gemmataceae bacterium]